MIKSEPCKAGEVRHGRFRRPITIEAAAEVTKPLKPSVQRVAWRDLMTMQAVTRVNAEDASKRVMKVSGISGEGVPLACRRQPINQGVNTLYSNEGYRT